MCDADEPDGEGLWSRALEQMKTSYFEALLNGESSLQARIKPIYNFVKHKAETAAGALLVHDEGDYEETAFWRDINEMASYMSMYYALTHDGKGNEVAPPQVMSAAYAAHINGPFAETERVHMIMARKAWHLYHSIQEKGQHFLDKTGLKAFLFALLKAAAAADSVEEVIVAPAIRHVEEGAVVREVEQNVGLEEELPLDDGENGKNEFDD